MSRPIHKIRDGLIKATIWENSGQDGRVFYSVDLRRSYTDGNGEWKETTSLSGSDVLRGANLLQRAYNWTVDQRGEGWRSGTEAEGGDDEIPL